MKFEIRDGQVVLIWPSGSRHLVAYEDKVKDGSGPGAGVDYRAYFYLQDDGQPFYLPRFKRTLDRLFAQLEAEEKK